VLPREIRPTGEGREYTKGAGGVGGRGGNRFPMKRNAMKRMKINHGDGRKHRGQKRRSNGEKKIQGFNKKITSK